MLCEQYEMGEILRGTAISLQRTTNSSRTEVTPSMTSVVLINSSMSKSPCAQFLPMVTAPSKQLTILSPFECETRPPTRCARVHAVPRLITSRSFVASMISRTMSGPPPKTAQSPDGSSREWRNPNKSSFYLVMTNPSLEAPHLPWRAILAPVR